MQKRNFRATRTQKEGARERPQRAGAPRTAATAARTGAVHMSTSTLSSLSRYMWTHTSRARETRDDAQHTIHTLLHGTTHTITRHDAHSHTARHTLSHGTKHIISRHDTHSHTARYTHSPSTSSPASCDGDARDQSPPQRSTLSVSRRSRSSCSRRSATPTRARAARTSREALSPATVTLSGVMGRHSFSFFAPCHHSVGPCSPRSARARAARPSSHAWHRAPPRARRRPPSAARHRPWFERACATVALSRRTTILTARHSFTPLDLAP